MDLSELSIEERQTEAGIATINRIAWEQGVSNSQQLKECSEETLANSQKIYYFSGQAQALRNLAYWSLVFGSNKRRAVELAQAGLLLLHGKEDMATSAELYDILAMCFIQLGSFERSLDYTRESMELFKQVGNTRGLAWSHRNLGNLYRDASDYELAESNYQEALRLFQELQHFNGISRVYNSLGQLQAEQKNYQQAIHYQELSLQAEEEAGLFGIGYAGTLLYLGCVYNNIGDTQHALEYLEKSKAIVEKHHPEQPEKNGNYTEILLEMGIAYRKQNQIDKAIDYLNHSIRSAELSENKKQEYNAYKNLAECYDTLKDYHTSLSHYKKYTLLQEKYLIGENTLKLDNLNMSQEILLAEVEKDAERKLKEETEKILLRILPKKVVAELRETGKVEPHSFIETTVLFSDFVGFTEIAKKMSAESLVANLDLCFSEMDKIVHSYGLERMKTIGDGYMAVSGVPMPLQDHAVRSILAGLDVMSFIKNLKKEREEQGETFWDLRLGINSGSLIAGIIGHSKFAYDVWGETVNIASRMESYGEKGSVNISASTYELVKEYFDCSNRGEVEVKHGVKHVMYLVEKIKEKYNTTAWKESFLYTESLLSHKN